MSYETYEPGATSPEHTSGSYDRYEPGGSTYRSAVSPRTSYRSSSGGSSSSSTATVGRVAGALIGVVTAIVGITQANDTQTTPTGPDTSGYAACADAHDEDSSLFTDAEWCIDGPGGSFDVTDSEGYDPDPYGFDDPYGDSYGYDSDPYGFDDPYGYDGSSLP